MSTSCVIGVDLGGTKCAGGLLRLSTGEVLSRRLQATAAARGGVAILEDVVELVAGERARTVRVARSDDFYFQGHFPGQPVVPAVMLVELIAQTGGIAACSGAVPVPAGGLRLAALGGFKFPAAAGPGDLLEATARVVGRALWLIRIEGEVTASGRRVAVGSLTLAPGPVAQADTSPSR